MSPPPAGADPGFSIEGGADHPGGPTSGATKCSKKQECIPVGCVHSAAVVVYFGEVSAQWGCLPGGRGVCSRRYLADSPFPVKRMTERKV